MGSRPSLEAVLRPFTSSRARGRWVDLSLFGALTAGQAVLRLFPGRGRRPVHPRLLAAAVQEVLRCYRDPVCVETGCRGPTTGSDGGTGSTVAMASVLRGQGRLLSLEEDEERIKASRSACGSLAQWVDYHHGDPVRTIRRLKEAGDLQRVHLAYFPATDDPGALLDQFRALADLVVDGGLVVVDRALSFPPATPSMTEQLRQEEGWDVRLVHAASGLVVARRESGG